MKLQRKLSKQDVPDLIEKHVPGFTKQNVKLQSLMGMTNLTMKATGPDNHTIIFRLFAGDFDRKYQNKLIDELSKQGVAPKCYFSNEQYRIQEYINNAVHPVCKQTWENYQTFKMILQQMCKFHQTKLSPEITKRVLTDKLFSQKNKNKIQNIKKQQCEDQKLFQELKKQILHQFQEIKKIFQQHFKQKKDTIKLCHNDLNNLNIFIQEGKRAKLIDFQYTRYNYLAYDIANFLNQFCFQYKNEEPGFTVDRTLDEEKVQSIVKHYPNYYKGLAKDVMVMFIVCNYYWAVWSLNIPRTESSPYFLPLQHGRKRMQLVQHYKKLTQ